MGVYVPLFLDNGIQCHQVNCKKKSGKDKDVSFDKIREGKKGILIHSCKEKACSNISLKGKVEK